jgi:hypothetical protein
MISRLVALLFAVATDAQFTLQLLDKAKYPMAQCLDGSMGEDWR